MPPWHGVRTLPGSGSIHRHACRPPGTCSIRAPRNTHEGPQTHACGPPGTHTRAPRRTRCLHLTPHSHLAPLSPSPSSLPPPHHPHPQIPPKPTSCCAPPPSCSCVAPRRTGPYASGTWRRHCRGWAAQTHRCVCVCVCVCVCGGGEGQQVCVEGAAGERKLKEKVVIRCRRNEFLFLERPFLSDLRAPCGRKPSSETREKMAEI